MKTQSCNVVFLTFVILSGSVFAFAQTSREKGIALFDQEKDQDAIIEFKAALKVEKNDPQLLNYLGLAYLNLGKYKDAQKALQKAVNVNPQSSTFRTNLAHVYLLTRKVNKSQSELAKAIQLDPNNAKAYYIRGTSYLWERKYDAAIADAEIAIKLDQDFSEAYILKSDGLLYSFGKKWEADNEPIKSLYLLENAVNELNNCAGNCLGAKISEIIKDRKETVQAFLDYFARQKAANENSDDSGLSERTPLTILSKPAPSYTDRARQNNENGKVTLAVLFGADAQIKFIIVLEGLNFGLTEQAIAAARRITFEPAKEGGKPVSTVKRIQYGFSVY